MQLHAIDTETSPPYPRASGETRTLRNLPGVQNRKQSRVDEQCLRVPDHLGEYVAAQRLQEAPELPHPSMERGRVQPYYPREKVREEPLSERRARRSVRSPLPAAAGRVPEECQGDNLRVGELLEGFIASFTRVEQRLSVVHYAEEDGEGLFRVGELWGMVGLGHLLLLCEGRL